jgi:aflatoxin B1 aldehyde reductase
MPKMLYINSSEGYNIHGDYSLAVFMAFNNSMNLIFGAANIGECFVAHDEILSILSKLEAIGIKRIDTAARYPPTSPGASEKLLGAANAASLGFLIDTKVKVTGDGHGSLSAQAIADSITESFERLGVDKVQSLWSVVVCVIQSDDVEQVSILYCHRPDVATPLKETAIAFDSQFRKGKFDEVRSHCFEHLLVI